MERAGGGDAVGKARFTRDSALQFKDPTSEFAEKERQREREVFKPTLPAL